MIFNKEMMDLSGILCLYFLCQVIVKKTTVLYLLSESYKNEVYRIRKTIVSAIS